MNPIKISVVVLSYNTEEILRNCLRSLRDSVDVAKEVIVVDNASSDGSVEMVKTEFPEAKLIISPINSGYAAGNNLGIKAATGEYVLLLNSDTTVPSNTPLYMVGYMDEHPDVGAATCYVELVKTGGLDPSCHRGFPTPWASFCYYAKLDKLFPKSKVFGGYHLGYKDPSQVHEIDSPMGAFYLVRRKVIDQVGILSEDYFFYAEDLDWSFRIKQAGWKIMFVPQVKILHFKGASSGIKGHSQLITTANNETRLRSVAAFYDTMKIFYKKHLEEKYPFFINWLVYFGINLKKTLALRSKVV